MSVSLLNKTAYPFARYRVPGDIQEDVASDLHNALPTMAVAKQQAKDLRAAYAQRGLSKSHSEALDEVGRVWDFRDWRTLRAKIEWLSDYPKAIRDCAGKLPFTDEELHALCSACAYDFFGGDPVPAGAFAFKVEAANLGASDYDFDLDGLLAKIWALTPAQCRDLSYLIEAHRCMEAEDIESTLEFVMPGVNTPPALTDDEIAALLSVADGGLAPMGAALDLERRGLLHIKAGELTKSGWAAYRRIPAVRKMFAQAAAEFSVPPDKAPGRFEVWQHGVRKLTTKT